MRPVHAGARLDVPFEIVGVQFHQPRQHVIAAAVDRARRHVSAGADLRDHPVLNAKLARDHPLVQNEARIGKAERG